MVKKVAYTVEEVAELLGIGRSSAYQAVRAGEIPSIRLGRRWLVPKFAFAEFLERRQGMWIEANGHQTQNPLGGQE